MELRWYTAENIGSSFMKADQYIAHFDEFSGRVQTCKEHCKNVALVAQQALSYIGLGKTA